MTTTRNWNAWKSYIYTASHILAGSDMQLKQLSGISLSDFDILVTVASAPKQTLTMSCLKATVLVTISGLSRSVTRLEDRGWITKTADRNDKRQLHVTLTEAGAQALEKIRPQHLDFVQDKFFDALDAEDQAQLERILGKIEKNLNQPEEKTPEN